MIKLILLALVFLLSIGAQSTNGQQESMIVGSGFLQQDLIYPYSIQISDSKIYLLDQNWIKIYDKKTNKFLKQIDLSNQITQHRSIDWIKNFISDELIGPSYFDLLPNDFNIPLGIFVKGTDIDLLYDFVEKNQFLYTDNSLVSEKNTELYRMNYDGSNSNTTQC